MKKSDTNKVGFLLSNIKTIQFATIESAYQEGSTGDLKLRFNFGIPEGKKWLACDADVEFLMNDQPFVIIKVRCEFAIEPDAWDSFVDSEQNEITFSDGFLRHLAVLTIGTTRGILHAKLEDTPFDQMILPTVNIVDLIEQPLTFDLGEKKVSTQYK